MNNYSRYAPARMEDLTPIEVWWPVVGNVYFNGELILTIPLGEYEGSNIGRVRCLNYGGIKGNVQVLRQCYLQGGKIENDWLQTKVFGKLVKVHTIIALTFIGERPEGFEVDHINFRRDDNRIENIRYLPKSENSGRHGAEGIQKQKEARDKLWSDDEFRKQQSETMALRWNDDGYRNKIEPILERGRSSEFDEKRKEGLRNKYKNDIDYRNMKSDAMKELNKGKRQTVLQYSISDGKLIRIWDSSHQVERVLGFDQGNIVNACNRKKRVKQMYGYIWSYTELSKDELNTIIEKIKQGQCKLVEQIDRETGKVIKVWNSIKDAAKELGIQASSISQCINGKLHTAGCFAWRMAQ